MTRLRCGWKRFRGVFTGHQWERECADELESHILMQTEDNIRLGMSEEEARRTAVLKFGSRESTREDLRDQRGLPRLAWFVKDVRYAVRGLRRNPGFAAAAIATLALGVGANTAIFDVAYAVLLKPLPYSDPGRLYSVGVLVPDRRQSGHLPIPIQSYLQWRAADTAFASMSALRPWQCNLTGEGEPERVGGARVSTNFFSLLGIAIPHGRAFLPDEEQPGNDRVVVISDALWRRRHGGDPALVGRSIDVDGESHLVVGIAPPSLLVPTETQLAQRLAFGPRIDIWKPIAPTREDLERENWNHALLVRVKSGHDPETGRQQLQASLNARVRARSPNPSVDLTIQLTPLREVYTGSARLPLLLVLGASSLLLLTACANIANLFLVRAANRSAEFATRMALGAGRGRILSLAITECTLLAILGGAAGVVIAKYGANLLATFGPQELRQLADTRVNPPSLFFAVAASVMTGIVCGFVSSAQVSRTAAARPLLDGARTVLGGSGARRVRQSLAATEVALGTVLLISAALLLHSFVKVTNVDRGYQAERVLTADVALSGSRYAGSAAQVGFYRELVRDVRGLPGVLAAGAISHLPAVAAAGAQQTVLYASDTNMQDVVLDRPVALIRSVTTGYFAAIAIALQAGRFFDDRETGSVALISESLAARLWPGEAPSAVVGRGLRHGNVTGTPILVVGVVREIRSGAGDGQPGPIIYRPDEQWTSGAMSLVIKTAGDPGALAASVRAAIRKLDSALPVTSIRTMREILSESVAHRRFQMMLISLFGLVAMLLGAVGTYAVISYSIAYRTREIGLRLALGATRGDVMRAAVLEGMKPVLVGLLAGGGTAIAIATALRSSLYGITPTDPLSLGVVTGVLLFTSSMACYIPARRAARLDAMVALRHM
jgi:putative ABC transport system permease protein